MTKVENINAETLRDWLTDGRAVLVDVREPDEYRHERIQGAVNMPLSSLAGQTIPVTEGKAVVLQCRSGNRSQQAAHQIAANDSKAPLYNLSGGIEGWKKAGFKISKPEKAVLPLQRQVQIAVGALVFLTVVLGYFVHPGFLAATAFIGVGLLNAGLTGWCGMANALVRMPWNKQNEG